MKKIFVSLILFSFIFLCFFNIENSFSYAETQHIVINSAFSYLYKEANYSEHYEFKIKNGEIILLTGESNNFYQVSYSYENVDYLGYIPTELASIYREDRTEIPVYNGKIIKQTEVLSLENKKLENILLNEGHQIYLYEGFDSKKEYTKIKFSYNNQIYVGQVKTENLSPNGINKAVIIAYSTITAIVGIVLILLGLKKSKKKKWHNLLKKSK